MNPIDTGTLATTGAEGGGSAVARQLVATASSAALSAASAVSSSNLPHAPAVLAAQHWPEFHNGVAAGLMISPHAPVSYLLYSTIEFITKVSVKYFEPCILTAIISLVL